MTVIQHPSESPAPNPGGPSQGPPRLNCEQLVAAITEYLEGAMTSDARTRLEAHLSRCPPCQVYLEQIKVTIAATGRLRTSDVSPEAKAVLLDLFRAWAAED